MPIVNRVLNVDVKDAVAQAGDQPIAQLQAVYDMTSKVKANVAAAASNFAVDANGNVTYKGKRYSIYARLDQASQAKARELADATDVRADKGIGFASFGMSEQKAMSKLTDKLIDDASQFELDRALAKSAKGMQQIAVEGLNLKLIEKKGRVGEFVEEHLPALSGLTAFLNDVRSIRARIAGCDVQFTQEDAQILTRVGLYSDLSDGYVAQIDEFLIVAAASELIYEREDQEFARLSDLAKTDGGNTKLSVQLTRQTTIRIVTLTQTFNLLSYSVNANIKVEVVENALMGAILAHQAVIKARYFALEEIKNSMAMIINAYRTQKTMERAQIVDQVALNALNKSVEQGKITVEMLQGMSDGQKNAIGAYLTALDGITDVIESANTVIDDLKVNLGELINAADDITTGLNKAHAQIKPATA